MRSNDGWIRAASRLEGLALALLALGSALAFDALGTAVARADDAPTAPVLTENTFAELAEKTLPSVVAVYVKTNIREQLRQLQSDPRHAPFLDEERLKKFFEEHPEGEEGQEGEEGEAAPGEEIRTSGSGVIISEDGYIVTNLHIIAAPGGVVPEGSISVVLHDDTEIGADKVKVVATDELIDLAVLKIDAEGLSLAPLPWGDSDALRIGEWVVAIGNPLDLRGTVSQGIVSAKARKIDKVAIEHLIQVDAMINPGNSGGALINLRGELVGVNMAIATNSGFFQGIGFAIPARDARFVCDQVIEYGRIRRGYIGIYMQEADELVQAGLGLKGKISGGTLVSDVVAEAPAAKAGVLPRDVIVMVDDIGVKNPQDLLEAIATKQVGEKARLTLWRAGEDGTPVEVELEMEVTERPPPDRLQNQGDDLSILRGRTVTVRDSAAARIGLTVEPFELGELKGLEIVSLRPDSSAAAAGLRPADIVVEANLKPVTTPEELEAALAEREEAGDAAHFLRVLQDGRYFYRGVPQAR